MVLITDFIELNATNSILTRSIILVYTIFCARLYVVIIFDSIEIWLTVYIWITYLFLFWYVYQWFDRIEILDVSHLIFNVSDLLALASYLLVLVRILIMY